LGVKASLAERHIARAQRRNEKLDYVYLDAEHNNPFKRVVPAALIDHEDMYYDRDKYTEMVLDVAETVLGVFGFDREQLGIKKKPRNYLEELRNDRTRGAVAELSSLMGWD
jgi:hypothetical protein